MPHLYLKFVGSQDPRIYFLLPIWMVLSLYMIRRKMMLRSYQKRMAHIRTEVQRKATEAGSTLPNFMWTSLYTPKTRNSIPSPSGSYQTSASTPLHSPRTIDILAVVSEDGTLRIIDYLKEQ
jgi:hypothetical protein